MSGENRHVKGNIRNWKGIQLDYDNTVVNASDDYLLYCLSNTQAEAIRSLLGVQAWKTRWFSPTDEIIDKDKIDEWTSEVITRLMDGCCCGGSGSEPKLNRWTENGHYQISNDDGETWEDAPLEDPRYGVTIFPPALPPEVLDPECTYADSIVNLMKTQLVEAIGVGDSLQVIAGIILGVISAVLGTVAAPLVYQILAVIAAAIFNITVEAFQDAFTEDVWNRLRCNIFDNMGSEGSFTQTQVDAIYSRIGSEETGIAYLVLRQVVAAFGATGMTNAARSGFGDPEAENCDCTECVTEPIQGSGYSTFISFDDDTCVWTFESLPDPGNPSIQLMGVDFPSLCGIPTEITIVSGGGGGGSFPWFYHLASGGSEQPSTVPPNTLEVDYWGYRSNVVTQISFKTAPCE